MKLPPLVQALLWMAATPMCACAGDPVTIAILNYGGVPRCVLADAAATARLAYRVAGIETAWPICGISPDGEKLCTSPLPANGNYMEIELMDHRTGAVHVCLRDGEPAGLALTGADLPRPRAYVFFAATRDASIVSDRPLALVLGLVLVHESGHLLGLQHQPRGVMRGRIDARDIDDAIAGRPFSFAEIHQLQAHLKINLTAARR
jgi:hypothetical protein